MEKIDKYKIKIDKILILDNVLNLLSSNGQIFKSEILKGSIGFKIFNESEQEVNLSNLEEGDIIKVYGTYGTYGKYEKYRTLNNNQEAGEINIINDSNNLNGKKISQKNNIIIKKIIIKNKYVFNSESSDDLENYS